jgi:hypothetical protein
MMVFGVDEWLHHGIVPDQLWTARSDCGASRQQVVDTSKYLPMMHVIGMPSEWLVGVVLLNFQGRQYGESVP